MHLHALCIAACAVAAVPAMAAAEAPDAPWRTYQVYQPRVERGYVLDAGRSALKYNHDSSIAWFGDRWFCLWNANQVPIEGKPGQLNYGSTSRDGITWSPPEAVFSDARFCENPIPCPTGTQWQPNLIVVAGELWAVWSQNSRDDHTGCYLSRLAAPDGKWVNQRMLWDGNPQPEVDGKRWRPFPTQNPIRLRSGRVLAPATFIGPNAADAPSTVTGWWATEKRDSVLYTDDGGATWHASPGAIQPGRSWAQWEPTVWELPDGTVMMVARNNDFRARTAAGPRPAEMLLWSKSSDGGATWTPHAPVPLETVASRMHVLPAGGDRFTMVHNDWPAGAFVADRVNLALFFTRGAGVDFVAGPGISRAESVACYPQMWVHDGQLAISYSQGSAIRSIRVVRVSPLPDPARHYLFPRDNVPPSPRPERAGDALRFESRQRAEGRRPLDPGEEGFSAGLWVRPSAAGVLLDSRSNKPIGGLVWGLRGSEGGGLAPFIHLRTPEGNLQSTLQIPQFQWSYVGVTVDNRAGRATFHVNGASEAVAFTAPAPGTLRGATPFLGCKRFAESSLYGLEGEIRALAVYPGAGVGTAEHHWLGNAFAAALGQPPRAPAAKPNADPVLWFDPADAAALARDFVLPDDAVEGVTTARVEGREALRFAGESSAGVDLDENQRDRGDRVDLEFRFRVESGKEHVLCTLGDANEPARLLARKGEVWLAAGGREARCGRVVPDGWTAVVLSTAGTETTAAVEGGAPVAVSHRPTGTWAYLGQGYRTGQIPAASRFLVDVGSVRSRVVRRRS